MQAHVDFSVFNCGKQAKVTLNGQYLKSSLFEHLFDLWWGVRLNLPLSFVKLTLLMPLKFSFVTCIPHFVEGVTNQRALRD